MGYGEWIHAEGPIKTFTLRGIKDSPPYLHDGRLLTLEDTAVNVLALPASHRCDRCLHVSRTILQERLRTMLAGEGVADGRRALRQ